MVISEKYKMFIEEKEKFIRDFLYIFVVLKITKLHLLNPLRKPICVLKAFIYTVMKNCPTPVYI